MNLTGSGGLRPLPQQGVKIKTMVIRRQIQRWYPATVAELAVILLPGHSTD